MTATQFLGAFNDNLFKQVVLLMCVDMIRRQGDRDFQPLAQGLFALPFILFSGFAGFLSDRTSKRKIVILCKYAEIGIVILAPLALSSGSLPAALAVLFLLGSQSAFFGPSKFGILPELVRERDLPDANGIFLMTTFSAIILGTAAAGKLKGFLPDGLGIVAIAYLAVAITGVLTSHLIRKTPVAKPGLKFEWSDLIVSGETVRMFLVDRPLLLALAMYSLFWLIGGLVLPSVNAFGKLQLFGNLPREQADTSTSFMAAFLVIGIALGCVAAGRLSGKRVNFRLVPWGCWIMVFGLGMMEVVGRFGPQPGSDAPSILSRGAVENLSKILLVVMGLGAGIFTVPLQVFLQSRPPVDQKGRVIGAMNLVNWIGIFLSAGIYSLFDVARGHLGRPPSALFGATALLLLPVAIFYRPRTTESPWARAAADE
jgi:MFS family permease